MINKLLIVEDDDVSIFLMKHLVEQSGIVKELRIARDGEEGLGAMESFQPDFVLLDMSMPVLDGYGFLSILEEKKMHQNTPVMVLSSSERDEETARYEAFANVVAVESKPLTIQLIQRINALQRML